MVDDHKRARALARRDDAMKTAGLVVLLERAGGSARYTEAEYQAVSARYGGPTKLAVHMELVRAEGKPDEVRLSLILKPPANAELVS